MYPGWFFLGEVMDHMWLVAKCIVQQVGAWMLDKTNVLPHEREPPDPPHKPVQGEARQQVKRDLLAALSGMMLKHQAMAQGPDVQAKSPLSPSKH